MYKNIINTLIIFSIINKEVTQLKLTHMSNEIIEKFKDNSGIEINGIISIPNKIQSRVIDYYNHKNNDFENENELSENMLNSLRIYYGEPYFYHTICNKTFRISAESFCQPHIHQVTNLYKEIIKGLKLSKQDIVWDLFCGMGSIGITLANNVKSVYGFEMIHEAIYDAKHNAEINNIKNCNFYELDLSNPSILNSNFPKPNIIIVDPNRPGLSKDLLKLLISIKPKQICYVSCNIISQINDLKYLIENGYKIKYFQPVDMLPQTPHIENIAFLTII